MTDCNLSSGINAQDHGIETIDLGDIGNNLGNADFDIAKERFILARDILLYLFCLIVFIIILRVIPENSNSESVKEVFSTIFQSVVPIASLIIGYYFGSKGEKD
ncbi:hypothetical protein H4F33_20720 [Pectobacterium brasiliense]|uniref:hypothetical protein n=1 Tax=Pectobacterium brasiliense TaxID=180957 RepID=UPI001968BED8|nr:hypothetical protein [Pectobacterium brasiliense]MBN3074472.1 hypothetical protein [Pectobacterium brasiliense]MBN3170501.1 hypothetical protein [Pectobacterium brasiliense]